MTELIAFDFDFESQVITFDFEREFGSPIGLEDWRASGLWKEKRPCWFRTQRNKIQNPNKTYHITMFERHELFYYL